MNFANFFNFNASTAGIVPHDEMVEIVRTGSAHVVDVREEHEFRSGAIEGAINVPLSRFNPNAVPKDKPVVVYCLSGARSGTAKQILEGSGHTDVRNYRSGVGVWRMQGGRLV